MPKNSTNKQKIDKKALGPLFKSAKRDYKKYTKFTEALENPNRMLQKTKEGMRLGLELFREMESDSQIGSDLQARKLKVRSFSWNVICEDGNESDIEFAKEIENQLRPVYRTLVKEIQDALVMGFSVTELNWEEIEGKITLPSVTGHDQKKFVFSKEGGLFLIEGETPVWEERVILATFDMRKGNRYGRSLLTDAFWPWFFKKHGWLFWSNYLEKFGQPTVVGKYPSSITDKDTKDELLSCCQAIQNDMAVTVPQEWVIELLEAKRAGAADTYESFVKYCDRCLSKVILLSVLTSNEAQFGTKAHADVHKDLTDEAVEDDALWIADEISNQVVTPLARWNTNSTAQYRLEIQYETEDTGKESAERDEILTKVVPVRIDDLREKYNFQTPGDDDIIVFQGNLYRWGSIKEKIMSGESILPQAADQPGPTSNFAEFSEGDIDDIDHLVLQEGEYVAALWDHNRKKLQEAVDTKQLEKVLKNADDYDKAILRLKEFKSKKAAKAWEPLLKIGHMMGELSVQNQIEMIPTSANFAELDPAIDDAFHILEPKDAVKYFERRVAVKKEVWELLGPRVKNSAFYVADLEDINLINRVKRKMITALLEGRTYKQFFQDIFFDPDEFLLFGNMKNAFHTNMFQALAVQNEQALLRNVKTFPWWRYSAILDGKTRESHAAQHGVVARYDDPYWQTWSPPNGFYCRCVKTIARNEQVDVGQEKLSLSKEKGYVPDSGFERNPLDFSYPLLKKFKEGYGMKLNEAIRAIWGNDMKAFEAIKDELGL